MRVYRDWPKLFAFAAGVLAGIVGGSFIVNIILAWINHD